MQNPFESGHIKNYILLYASVVVIMILFFIASTIFRENKEIDKKVFSTQETEAVKEANKTQEKQESFGSGVKLMEKKY